MEEREKERHEWFYDSCSAGAEEGRVNEWKGNNVIIEYVISQLPRSLFYVLHGNIL